MDITIMGKRPLRESKICKMGRFYCYGKLCLYVHNRHLPVSNYQPVALGMWWLCFARLTKKGKNVFVDGGNSLVGLLLMRIFDHLIIQIAPYLERGFPYPRGRAKRFTNWQPQTILAHLQSLEPAEKSEIEKGVDCMIKIYDTNFVIWRELSQSKKVLHVCSGPTVYNYIHVGNARSTVAFDTIRRYFECGYEGPFPVHRCRR